MYEYKILHSNGIVGEDELNGLGQDRWILCDVIRENDNLYYIFHRTLSFNFNEVQLTNVVDRAIQRHANKT